MISCTRTSFNDSHTTADPLFIKQQGGKHKSAPRVSCYHKYLSPSLHLAACRHNITITGFVSGARLFITLCCKLHTRLLLTSFTEEGNKIFPKRFPLGALMGAGFTLLSPAVRRSHRKVGQRWNGRPNKEAGCTVRCIEAFVCSSRSSPVAFKPSLTFTNESDRSIDPSSSGIPARIDRSRAPDSPPPLMGNSFSARAVWKSGELPAAHSLAGPEPSSAKGICSARFHSGHAAEPCVRPRERLGFCADHNWGGG